MSGAVASATLLPEKGQDALATILLEKMESEERWNADFSDSQNLLAVTFRKDVAGWRHSGRLQKE